MNEDKDFYARIDQAVLDYLDLCTRKGGAADPQIFLLQQPEELRPELERRLADLAALRNLLEAKDFTAGSVIGDFRLLQRLGSGGMGEVWEAEDRRLGRRVALKLLPAALGASPSRLQRFEREARAGARLRHRNIAAVYHFGSHQGVPFFTQELVPGGRTLATRIDELRQRPDLPEGHFKAAAECIAQVAEGLQAAHQERILHRDVKPKNVLLAEDRPLVCDFGLAALRDDPDPSTSREQLGTPYYMSPEHIYPERPVDERSDVFSLGVTLYELLTLVRPFEGESTAKVTEKILLVDPRDPRRLRPGVPRDLAVICLKALEKQPERRYPSMGEFAADLRRWLRNLPITARPTGPLRRTGKWLRRHPATAASGCIGLASLSVISVLLAGLLRAAQENKAVVGAFSGLLDVQEEDRLQLYRPGAFLRGGLARARQQLTRLPSALAKIEVRLGREFVAAGLPDEAEQVFRQAIPALPGGRAGRYWRACATADWGWALLKMQSFAEAREKLALAEWELLELQGEASPEVLEVRERLALLDAEEGNFLEAEQRLAGLIEQQEARHGADSLEVWRLKGRLAYLHGLAGRDEQAILGYQEVVAAYRRSLGAEDPRTLAALKSLGWILFEANRWKDAERCFREAFDLDPRNPQHGFDLAFFLLRTGVLNSEIARRAQDLLDRAVLLSLSDSRTDYVRARAMVMISLGEFEAAKKLVDLALELAAPWERAELEETKRLLEIFK